MTREIRRRGANRPKQQEHQESRQEGQSLVEMAIAFPILLLLVAAVVDFARVLDASIVLTNAVREGARFGSKDASLTQADIQNIVVGDVVGSGTNITQMADFDASHVTVTAGTDDVTVLATYDFELWFGGVVGMNTVRLEREAVMPRF
jgi:Flp pilus assembly protein TadG